jgi:hypothetical protein
MQEIGSARDNVLSCIAQGFVRKIGVGVMGVSSNRRIFLSIFIVTILFAILKLFYHSKHGTKSARLVAPFQPE